MFDHFYFTSGYNYNDMIIPGYIYYIKVTSLVFLSRMQICNEVYSMISAFVADMYVSTVGFIILSRQEGLSRNFQLTFYVSSNYSQHLILATMFCLILQLTFNFSSKYRHYSMLYPLYLYQVSSDIQYQLRRFPTFNVRSFVFDLKLYLTFTVSSDDS